MWLKSKYVFKGGGVYSGAHKEAVTLLDLNIDLNKTIQYNQNTLKY